MKSHVTGITPANISTLRIKDLYGKNATLVGWDNEPDGRTRYLRQAKVKILTAMNCKLRTEIITNMIVHIPEGHFCTAADLFVLSTDVLQSLLTYLLEIDCLGLDKTYIPSFFSE